MKLNFNCIFCRRVVSRVLAVSMATALLACACSGREPHPPAVVGTAAGGDPRTAAAADADAAAGRFSGGAVSASDPLAAAAGAEVLRRGGNAVDAAAVALFMLNVGEPESSGIGGGGFMLVHHSQTGETVVVDFRETAPAAATPAQFADAAGQPLPFALASTSGLAVGVPGALQGIATALERWGTLSLADALQPAIAAAEHGISVRARLARAIGEGVAAGGRLASEPGAGDAAYERARAVFAPGGRAAAVGDNLRQTALARALRAIAAGGVKAFYDCADPSGIARAIVASQRTGRSALGAAGRGRMTCADLAGYQAKLRAPVEASYRGLVVRSAPPPSAGGLALLQMLGMLERLPIGDVGAGFGPGAPATLDALQQAMRLAFADWAVWMGDVDALPGLPTAALIDRRYLAERAAHCPDDDARAGRYCLAPGRPASPPVRAGDPRPFIAEAPAAYFPAWRPVAEAAAPAGGENTTHLTVVDGDGMIVSVTSSVESSWGSGLMVEGFGFMLNNQLTDFNFVPRRRGQPGDADFDPGANDVAPGKRPRSSMAPVLLLRRQPDGRLQPVAAYGSPGGPSIINTVLQITLDLVDHRLALEDAVEQPRLSLTSGAAGAATAVEPGFDRAVLPALALLGYHLRQDPAIGAVQAIAADPDGKGIWAAADPRRNGGVAGIR